MIQIERSIPYGIVELQGFGIKNTPIEDMNIIFRRNPSISEDTSVLPVLILGPNEHWVISMRSYGKTNRQIDEMRGWKRGHAQKLIRQAVRINAPLKPEANKRVTVGSIASTLVAIRFHQRSQLFQEMLEAYTNQGYIY